MSKIDWNKARKFKESEEKYTPGAVLSNWRVIRDAPRDGLDARARLAEQRWMATLSERAKKCLK
jgi:hypothetical protein